MKKTLWVISMNLAYVNLAHCSSYVCPFFPHMHTLDGIILGDTMNAVELIRFIEETSIGLNLDPNLALAIAGHESGFNSDMTRYEPRWKYFLTPEKFAKNLGITVPTERVLQSISWGAMQLMGSVARELLYNDNLSRLIDPRLSIPLSCQKLILLGKKYPVLSDQVAAYNAGSPVKENGTYLNFTYVDDILKRLNLLKKSHPSK